MFRGIHPRTGVPVAVKVLHPATLGEDAPPEAFRNEVRAVAGLDHPGIVWVFDVGLVSAEAAAASGKTLLAGSPYLAMELASGGTLADWTPPDFDAVVSLIDELLAALAHAHARRVVHRDLKPGNVLRCTASDVRPGWKLSDFGIATSFEHTVEHSLSGNIMGTLSYMSPEQITGEWRSFGPWTDLYALGCVLYKVLSGRGLWETARGTALLTAHLERRPDPLRPSIPVPAGFYDWVAVLLEKRPADRFQSAAEAALALSELVGHGTMLGLPGDETLASAPTEVVGASSGRDPSGLPWDWSQHEAPWPPPMLLGAGMGMVGLHTSPMVGRTSERDQLWSALLQAARTHRPQGIVIRGHTGVGKTRLAQWIGQMAHELAGLPYLSGEARPGEGPDAATLRPFERWLRTRRLPADGRLRFLAERFDGADTRWIADLSALLGSSTDALRPPGSEPLEAVHLVPRGDARHLILGEAVARIGAPGRPAVLIYDNAHASTDVLRFALHLLQRGHHAPVLVVVVVSDEALIDDPVAAELLAALLRRATPLALEPLAPVDLARVIQGVVPVDPTVAAQVAERTGGNPLHALQVVQGWSRHVDGLTGPILTDVPPMEDVWRDRIEGVLQGLPPEARVLLERAAALGLQVDELHWQRVCDDPKGVYAAAGRVMLRPERARMRASLRTRLLASRLADEGPGGFTFAHEMFREAILRMATGAGRLPSHHRACARALLHLEDSHRHAERIGRHLLAGHRPDAAVPHLLVGIRRRRRRAGEASVLALLGEVHTSLVESGIPRWDRQWCELAALRGDVFVALGRAREAEDFAHEAIDLAQRGDWPDLEARGLWVGARVLLDHGDPEAADRLLARAEELLEVADDAALRGQVHASRSRCARERGEAGPSRGHALIAAQALKEAGNAAGLANAWQVLGEDALADGRLDDATASLQQAWVHHRGSPVGRGEVEALMGEVAAVEGDLEAARRWLQSACDQLVAVGSGRSARAMLALASVHLQRRDWRGARRVAGQLIRRLDLDPTLPTAVGAHAVLVAAAAGCRDWSSFDLHLERVRAGADAVKSWDPAIERALDLAAHRTDTAGEGQRAIDVRRLAQAFTRA